MRITDRMIAESALRNTETSLQAMSVTQDQIGSGKKLLQPSDDPTAVVSSIQTSDALAQINQYLRNIGTATNLTSAADSALADAGTVMQRANELAIEAANGTLGPSDRQAVEAEVDQLTAQLVTDANTKVGDTYIFSGTGGASGTGTVAAYSYTGAQDTGGTWTAPGSVSAYQGDDNAMQARISPGVTVQINVTADNAFGPALKALTELQSDLVAGNAPAGATLTDIQQGLNQITLSRASIGAAANRLQQTQSNLQNQQTAVTQLLSSLDDVDMASAISQLQQQQLTYNAALQVTGRILQTSLIDVLK